MTFDERVEALAPFGLTARQTRFVVTVALHGGFCLRRQYAAFAQIAYGHNAREFLDSLVTRDLARRFAFKRNRGFIYHVHGRSIYRAIAQEDNRNRRVSAPSLIARKLMLLDLVLSLPHVQWFATEHDKVSLFTNQFGIPLEDLPHRRYDSAQPGTPATTRRFIHKMPIYIAGEPPRVHFVCFADGVADTKCETFLCDHDRLLRHLSEWRLVVIAPANTVDFIASKRAFRRFTGAPEAMIAGLELRDLRWYCETRYAIEEGRFVQLTVDDVSRYRDFRRRLEPAVMDALYVDWRIRREGAFTRFTVGTGGPHTRARFESRALPFSYSQFGDLPGLC